MVLKLIAFFVLVVAEEQQKESKGRSIWLADNETEDMIDQLEKTQQVSRAERTESCVGLFGAFSTAIVLVLVCPDFKAAGIPSVLYYSLTIIISNV